MPCREFCEFLYNDFVKRDIWHDRTSGYTPKAGDLVIYDWPTNNRRYDHIGIVMSFDGDYIYTIEGNTTGVPGGKIATRKRENNSDIIGYGTPDYPETVDGGNE